MQIENIIECAMLLAGEEKNDDKHTHTQPNDEHPICHLLHS